MCWERDHPGATRADYLDHVMEKPSPGLAGPYSMSSGTGSTRPGHTRSG